VPYVLNSNHHTSITPEGAILINYYSDSDDFFEYDYVVSDLERIMVRAVFDEKKYFSELGFIELLKAGKSPLKKGVRPAHIMLLDELDQLSNASADIQELDLTGKRFREFPRTLTKIVSLKKLILNDNLIGSIPAAINDLVNLEELHLKNCGLKSLPVEIGLLSNLRVLNLSYNKQLILPESINQLSSLRVLNISYNTGFGLPASLTGLKELEELSCVQCSEDAPVEFPAAITQLSGLKRLLMEYNSIKAIPESILQLQHLEELNLGGSLCYLNELPKLKKLKILRANGSIRFSSSPSPKQSLLQSFFTITSLEALHIDRHGIREEVFIKNEFAKMEQNLAHDPERFQELTARLTDAPNEYWVNGKKGIVRDALKAEHLEGISNLQHLKVLDLSFNDLTSLPAEIAAMKSLQFVDLRYNCLSASERLKIAKDLPGCTIDFRDNHTETETADTEDVKQWQAMNKLIKEANALMHAKDDREKLLQSLIKYDEVLVFFSSGKVVDEYNLLYANYGKVYAYSYLTSTHKADFSPVELSDLLHDAIKQGLHTLSLVPSIIWHYTNLGKFHEEITRITANSVAWNMHVIYNTKEELEKALEIILKGVAYVENETHYFIFDTQVRILLKLGRTDEAYQIVKRTLARVPGFSDFQDLKTNEDYKIWLGKLK
jgi:Leucine-rich repeat (LRR) protein